MTMDDEQVENLVSVAYGLAIGLLLVPAVVLVYAIVEWAL